MLSGWEKALLGVLVIVLMVGMGATLTLGHFKEILKRPRGVLIGLFSQFGWMPLIAFALAKGFALNTEFAISLVIIGCTPGGTTSNMFTYYAKADLALSVAMTACSTIVAVGVMPLVLWIYASPFSQTAITIPYGEIIKTLLLVLVPVALGMAIRAKSARAATITERIGGAAGIGVLVVLVASGLAKHYQLLLDSTPAVLICTIGLGLCGMGLGYLFARLFGLNPAQRRAVSLETGIQNSPLAIAIIIFTFPESLHRKLLWLPLLYALFVLLSSSLVTLGFRLTAAPNPTVEAR